MSQPPKTATKQSSLQTSTKSKPEVVKKQEEILKQQAPKKSELRLPNNAAAPKNMKRTASQPAENFKRAPSQQAQNPSNTSREHSPKQSIMKTAQITVCHEENSKRTITEKKKIQAKIDTGIKKRIGILNVQKTEFSRTGSKTTIASKQKIGGLAKSRQVSRNQSPVSSDGQLNDGQNFKRGFNKLDNHASKQSNGPQISVNARDGKINRFDTQKTEQEELLIDDQDDGERRRPQIKINDDVANPMDEDLLDSGGNENNENDQSQENEGSNHQDDNHENISIDGDIHDDDDNDEQLIDDYIQDENPDHNDQEQQINYQNSEKKCDANNFKELKQENQRNQEQLISLNVPNITIQKEDEENVEFESDIIPEKELAIQNKNLDNQAILIQEPQEEQIKNEKEIINREETEVVQNTTENEQIREIQNCEIPQNSIEEMNEVNIKNEEITKNDSFEKEVQGKQQNIEAYDNIQLKQIDKSQENIDEITNTQEDHIEMKQSQVELKEKQEIAEPKQSSEILIKDDQTSQTIQLTGEEPQTTIFQQEQEELKNDELQHSSDRIATTEENLGKKEQEIENLANSSCEQILKDENPILQESPQQDENNEIQQENEILESNQNVGTNPNLLEQDIFETEQVVINEKQDSDDQHQVVQDQNDQKPQIDFLNQNPLPLPPVEVQQDIENDNQNNIEQILNDKKTQPDQKFQENQEEISRKEENCQNQGEQHENEQINELQPNSQESEKQETNLIAEQQQDEENKNKDFYDKEDVSSQNQPTQEENLLNNQNSVFIEQSQLLSANIQQINDQVCEKEEPHSIQKYEDDAQVQQSTSQDNQKNTHTQIDKISENGDVETKGLIQVQKSDEINQVNETNPTVPDLPINNQQLENNEEPNNSLTDQIENSPLEQKDENEFALQQQDLITEKQSIEQLIQISAQNQMDEEDLFDEHEENSPLKNHLAMEQQYTESDIDRRLQTIQEEEDGQRLRTENYDSLSDNNSNEDDVVRIEPEQTKSNTTESNPQQTTNTQLRNDEIPIENQEIQAQEQIGFELQEANLYKDQMFQKKKVENILENLPQCLYEMTSEQKEQQQIEEIQLKDDFIADFQLKINKNTEIQEGINQNTDQQKLQENNENFEQNEQSKNQLDNQNDDLNEEHNNDLNKKQTLNQDDEDVLLQKSRVSNKTRISHEIGDEQAENDIEINTQQLFKAVSYDQENDENDFPQQVQDAKNTERESLNLEIPGVFRSDELQNNQQQYSRKSSSNDELQSGNFYQQPSVPIHKNRNIPKLNFQQPFACAADKIGKESDRLDTGRTVESIMNQFQQQWLHPLESVSESVSITSEQQQQKPPNFVNNQQFFNQMKKKNIQIDVLSDIEESATPEHQARSANPTPKPLDSQKHTKNTMSFGIQQDQLNQQKKVPVSPNSQHQLINDDKVELQKIQQKREQDLKKKQKDSIKHKKKIEELEQKEKEKQFLLEKKRKEEAYKQRILELERILLFKEEELQMKNQEIQEQNINIYQYQKQIDSIPKLEQNENFQQIVELIDDHQTKMCELISNLKEDNFIVNQQKQKYQLLFQQQQIEFKQQLQLFSVHSQTDPIQLDLEQCLSIVPIQSIIEELFEKIKILRNQSHTTSYFIGQTSQETYSQMNQLSKRKEFKDRINELNETLKFEVDHLKKLIESENRELTANQINEILNSDIEMQNKVHQTLLNLNNIFKERLHQIKDGDDHMFKMLQQMRSK